MNAELPLATAPFRDPRYAPRRLIVEDRGRGEVVLTNPAAFSTEFDTTTASLAHWARAAPDRIWLAERSGAGWRTVTFAEAWQRIGALAAGLRGLGVVGERPLLILARNGIEHALIAYAAMGQGMPVAPVSPQYGLPGANLARLTYACEVLNPAAIFTEDALAWSYFKAGRLADAREAMTQARRTGTRDADILAHAKAIDAAAGQAAR